MDELMQCAQTFSHMVGKDYILTLENGIVLHIYFQKDQLRHLLGLHKLTDLNIFQANSKISAGAIFKMIHNGKLTLNDIKKSSFYGKVEQRIKLFPLIESVFDKKIVVDFDAHLPENCVLPAEYILYNRYLDGFLHLAIGHDINGQFPLSFFFEPTNYYVSGQNLLEVVSLEIVEFHPKGRYKRTVHTQAPED